MPNPQLPDEIFLGAFAGAPTRDLVPGQVLIAAGAPAGEVFNVLSGTLMMSRSGSDGRRQVLSFLFRDHFIGLTTADRYYFSVQAVTSACVACIPRADFEGRLRRNPEAERAFMNMAFRVLEDLLDTIYSLGQRTALERLAVFLLYLRHSRRLVEGLADDGDPALNDVSLPMTREDIADYLGLQKETVSRSFGQLERRRLIQRMGNHRVLLTELGQLRELAGVVDFASSYRLSRR